MRIKGIDLGKKFETRWIFKNITIELQLGNSLAITGANGSGKSTLLKILASSLSPSAGTINFYKGEQIVNPEEVSCNINFSAPYIELIEEYTLEEHLNFHAKFRNPTIPISAMMERMGYPQAANQAVREFSSGMKQRLQLALTFYYDSNMVVFDEPTSNLDESGIDWYLSEIKNIKGKRTILIASNQRYEYDFCQRTIQLTPL